MSSTENTEVKLKELLSGLSSLALSEAEAVSVMALLREKSPNALDAWHKVRDEQVTSLNRVFLTSGSSMFAFGSRPGICCVNVQRPTF